MITIPVPLSDRPYDVIVGPGAIGALADVVPPGARRAAIVTQAGIGVEVDPGIEHRTFLIGTGEETKTLAAVEDLCRQWAQWGLNRADVVVAVGGGMVTDVAGFAAAVFHRGVAVVHVSTTLLGQIDAAIGGKTGVNLPEGKNLVGAFWQPRAVLCDTDLLASLPPEELRSGMGELAKYHFLDDGSHGDRSLDELPFDEQVARCVAIKAAVVAGDEREDGRRATLNYGHTLGSRPRDRRPTSSSATARPSPSASSSRPSWPGCSGASTTSAWPSTGESWGPTTCPADLPAGSDPDQLVALFGRDKKAIDGVTFVLDGPDGVETVVGVDRSAIDAAFDAMTRTGDTVVPAEETL